MVNVKKVLMHLFLFIVLFQESIQRMVHVGALDYIDELVVIIFSLIALVNILRKKTIDKKIAFLFFLLVGFFLFGTLSLLLNSSFVFSRYIVSAFLATKCFLLIIDIGIIGFKDDTKKYFIEAINNIGMLCVFIGIFNFIFPSIYHKFFTFANVTYRFGFVSVTSLFYHTGRFGWFMLFLALMNYILYKNMEENRNRKLFFLFAFFSLLSFRTKVVFSVIIILIINLFLFKKIDLKKIFIAGVVSLVVFFAFNDIIMNTYHLYFDDETTTVSARQSLNNNSVKIVKDYFPFGVGFGKFGSWYARMYYSEYYYKYNMTRIYGLEPTNPGFASDTFWPAIFGESGFIGSVFYIYFIIYILLYFKRNLKINGNLNMISIYFGLLVLIQSLVESFGEPSFNSPPQYIFIGFIVGNALFETVKLNKIRDDVI